MVELTASDNRPSPSALRLRQTTGRQPDQASTENEPGRVRARANEQDRRTGSERRGRQVHQGDPGQVPRDDDEQRERSDVDPIEERAGGGRAPEPR